MIGSVHTQRWYRMALVAMVAMVAMGVLCPSRVLASSTVVLKAGRSEVPLGRTVEYLEDKKLELTFDQVRAAPHADRFRRSKDKVPNFGFTRSAYWFRFSVENPGTEHREWLLEIGYPLLDRIELFVEQPGAGFSRTLAGDHLPFAKRPLKHRHFVFPVRLAPGQRRQIYLRVRTQSSMQVPLTIWSPAGFHHADHDAQAALWLFYGIMLVMALYNLFLWISIRDRVYILYVVYISFTGLFQMALNGLAYEYLWSNWVWWANVCVPLLLGLACIFGVWFTRVFLDSYRQTPRLDKAILGAGGLGGVGIVLALVAPYHLAIRASVAAVAIAVVLIMFTAGYAVRQGYRPARYLFAAWLFFCVGTVLHSLKAFGALPANFLTNYGNNIGSALEVMLLSFALADRINALKSEKDEARASALESERRSLEIERESRETLQHEVDRQTEALRDANSQMQELDRQKTLFFQNISHELRSPLTVLLSPLEQLLAADLKGPENLAVGDKLQAMERNTHRLLRLVNQLLDFSQLESGNSTVNYERRDLGAFIMPILDGFEAFADARELRLELRAPETPTPVYFDPEKLDTALCNLLSNACKFTEPGGVVLVKITAGPDEACVEVKDNGIGIPPEQLEHIFDRFHQVEDAAPRRYQGTGIGLALAKELLEVMGGTLTVESDPGFGSTFAICLPLGADHIQDPTLIAQADAGGEADRVHPSLQAEHAVAALTAEVGGAVREVDDSTHGGPDDEPDGRPLVLVVEDSADMRQLVVDLCREEYRVVDAADGEQGLALLKDRDNEDLPALIISDIMMPGMDGHELLVQLRANPRTASIPVMLLTAKVGPERRIQSLEIGADEYLTKPFDGRELRARIRGLIRLKEQERQLRTLNRQLEELNIELGRQVAEKSADARRARELGRYLPPEVVATVLGDSGSGPPVLRHERCRLTVFRTELHGFDKIAETMEPEDLADLLNGYLSEMLQVSFEHGATVDHFVLDRVSGFFGAPHTKGERHDAHRCARMAVAMWERAITLCARWPDLTHLPVPRPTVVVHSGYATVGNFGSPDRLDYTAVGSVVQEAELLVRSVRDGVVCSGATWSKIREVTTGTEAGEVLLRRGGRPMTVFSLAGEPELAATPSSPEGLEGVGASTVRVDFRASSSLGPQSGFASVGGVMQLALGTVVADRYELLKSLGSGGAGSVYKAQDRKLELEVAIKLIRPELALSGARIGRLRSEVRLSRQVTHRNVARIYDIGEWPGGEFISMEYVGGESLRALLDREGTLEVAQAVEILLQVCAGLGAAHEVDVIHRDLKPANVICEPTGRVVILDFGIARAMASADASRADTRELVGTPHYMAPEQVTGVEVDRRADLYALGAVAFEMVTGQTVFQADSVLALAFKQISEPPPSPRSIRADLPAPLSDLITRCLHKELDQRPDSVAEITEILKSL